MHFRALNQHLHLLSLRIIGIGLQQFFPNRNGPLRIVLALPFHNAQVKQRLRVIRANS